MKSLACWCEARIERPGLLLLQRFLLLGGPLHRIDLSLREGDGDVVLLEGGPDLLTQFTADFQHFKGIADRKLKIAACK